MLIILDYSERNLQNNRRNFVSIATNEFILRKFIIIIIIIIVIIIIVIIIIITIIIVIIILKLTGRWQQDGLMWLALRSTSLD